MKMINAAVVGATLWSATVLVAATATPARAQAPQVRDAGQVTMAPAVPAPPPAGELQSRPLFTLGKLEVHLWAPVEASYDAHMNHTAAANPMWANAE